MSRRVDSAGADSAAPRRLVIVGAGMAAAHLLRELGRHPGAAQLAITVIGDEPEACYNRVLLSGVLAGDSAESDLPLLADCKLPPTLAFLCDTRVSAVDLQGCTVTTDSGRVLPFDQLVFATGASVARPPLAAADLAGVEVFRTLADARTLRQRARRGGAAVVVGGGLLGLEAAHGLNRLGFATTVVHRRDFLMNRQLDREGARQLQRDLENSGIRFRLGESIAALRSADGALTGVALAGGAGLPCELLVFATGIEPNAALAAAAGLAVERGILVDEYLRTTRSGVYALGECSQLGRHCFGLVAPIRGQASVLARELLGMPGEGFAIGHWPTQLKISGIDIYSAGELDADGEQLVLRDETGGCYRRLVLREGRLVGAVLVGDKRGGTWYSELIASGRDVSGVRSGLMFGREMCEALQATARAA